MQQSRQKVRDTKYVDIARLHDISSVIEYTKGMVTRTNHRAIDSLKIRDEVSLEYSNSTLVLRLTLRVLSIPKPCLSTMGLRGQVPCNNTDYTS